MRDEERKRDRAQRDKDLNNKLGLTIEKRWLSERGKIHNEIIKQAEREIDETKNYIKHQSLLQDQLIKLKKVYENVHQNQVRLDQLEKRLISSKEEQDEKMRISSSEYNARLKETADLLDELGLPLEALTQQLIDIKGTEKEQNAQAKANLKIMKATVAQAKKDAKDTSRISREMNEAGDNIGRASDKLRGVQGDLGKLGPTIKGSMIGMFNSLTGWFDNQLKKGPALVADAYKDASDLLDTSYQSGVGTQSAMEGMNNRIGSNGMLAINPKDMQDIVRQFSNVYAGLVSKGGANSTQEALKFAKQNQDTLVKMFGTNPAEIAKGFSQIADYARMKDPSIKSWQDVNKALPQAANELLALSRATGKTVSEVAELQTAFVKDSEIQKTLLGLDQKQRAARIKDLNQATDVLVTQGKTLEEAQGIVKDLQTARGQLSPEDRFKNDIQTSIQLQLTKNMLLKEGKIDSEQAKKFDNVAAQYQSGNVNQKDVVELASSKNSQGVTAGSAIQGVLQAPGHNANALVLGKAMGQGGSLTQIAAAGTQTDADKTRAEGIQKAADAAGMSLDQYAKAVADGDKSVQGVTTNLEHTFGDFNTVLKDRLTELNELLNKYKAEFSDPLVKGTAGVAATAGHAVIQGAGLFFGMKTAAKAAGAISSMLGAGGTAAAAGEGLAGAAGTGGIMSSIGAAGTTLAAGAGTAAAAIGGTGIAGLAGLGGVLGGGLGYGIHASGLGKYIGTDWIGDKIGDAIADNFGPSSHMKNAPTMAPAGGWKFTHPTTPTAIVDATGTGAPQTAFVDSDLAKMQTDKQLDATKVVQANTQITSQQLVKVVDLLSKQNDLIQRQLKKSVDARMDALKNQ